MAWVYDSYGRCVWINNYYGATSSTTTIYPTYMTLTQGTASSTMPSSNIMWMQQRRGYYGDPQTDTSAVGWARRNPEAEQRALFERERVRQAAMFEGHAEAASALADGLLMEHLTPEQRDSFKRNKWFVVEGGKSKIKYRICAKDNLIANVDVLEGEKVKHRLCAHADPKVMPLGDHLLAQKMMIEYAEDNFLRVANRHDYYGRA